MSLCRIDRTTLLLMLTAALLFLSGCSEPQAPEAATAESATADAPASMDKQFEGTKVALPNKAKELSKSGFPELPEGQSRSGRLTSASSLLPDGSHANAYRFDGQPGAAYRAQVMSSDFDAYVIVLDTDGGSLAEDDDSAGNLNAAAVFTMPSSGTVYVLANSFSAGEQGGYQVRVDTASGASGGGSGGSTSFDSGGAQLAEGERINGRLSADSLELSDGSYAAVYRLRGEPGSQVTVTMSSSDFDTYLIVEDLDSNGLGSNDDADGTNSEVTFTVPANGEYVVIANSFFAGETGAFVLTIGAGAASASAAMPSGDRRDGRYAMVVGVSRYANPANDLPLVANDTRAMVDMLIGELGYDEDYVYVLEDEAATRENILNGMTDFLGRVGPEGTALFYFSGHGTRTSENLGLTEPIDVETDGRDEALVAHDELILDDEMGIAFQRLNAGQIIVFYDSCHSGTGVRGADNLPKFLDEDEGKNYLPASFSAGLQQLDQFGNDFKAEVLNERITFVASSEQEELSWVAGEFGMSIYTYYLTTLLPEYLDRTVDEFGLAITDPVVSWTTSSVGQRQTPNVESQRGQTTLREILGM